MAPRIAEKIHLSAKGLLSIARKTFENVKEPIRGKQGQKQQIVNSVLKLTHLVPYPAV